MHYILTIDFFFIVSDFIVGDRAAAKWKLYLTSESIFSNNLRGGNGEIKKWNRRLEAEI